nr:hypothetical protein [Tanacetum cinerariifolium]
RVGGVEQAQLSGQLFGGLPVHFFALEQAQQAGLALDVHVDGADKLGGRDAPPEAKIDAILVVAHQPAQ